jgi:16S rRNA (cytosine1402-N4)-methyltransferase
MLLKALRIVVNDEIGALDEALRTIHHCVKPGGRLVVLSYHSLEDGRVKRLLKTGDPEISSTTETAGNSIERKFEKTLSRYSSVYSNSFSNETADISRPWLASFRRAQLPTEEEISRNRRARSAKLRVAERTIWGHEISSESSMEFNHKVGLSTRKQKYSSDLKGKKQIEREKFLNDREESF